MKMRLMFLFVACYLASFAAIAGNPGVVQVDTIEVPATYIESPMRVTVVLPEQYSLPEDTVRYPVVYMLNGYGGDYSSWATIRPDLDKLASLYGMILVCPDGRDSWYWDSPIDPKMQMESFITKELVPYIDANYRTRAEASGRAIMGLSMGGHGGLWLGIRHSDMFGSAGSTSGGVNILPFPSKWKIAKRLGEYEANKESWEQHTVINLVPTLKPGQINIIFDCGCDDFFAEKNEELHQAMLKHGIPHDYISRPGNHSQKYWNNSILYQLLYFSEQFKK